MRGTDGRKGILISEAAAKILGAHLGDDITITLTTDTGQYNSGTLVVRGIFRETSLFGYLAYMQLEALNDLTLRPKGSATDIAIYGKPGEDSSALAERVRQFLGRTHHVLPRMAAKADIDEALPGITEQSYAVLPLEGNLTQMRDIVQAFLAITWAAVAIFIAIVMVGILNTFRVIAYERTREIGTMRAIGMQRDSVLALFVIEAFLMALIACIGGVIVGYAGFGILGILDLGRIPVAGLFTERGRLGFFVDPATVFLDFCIMLGATIAAAFGPARRAAMADPAEALRTEG
jgi:ABC-type lipoprotein release transport system permease subunit